MYQAYANELLNQKEAVQEGYLSDNRQSDQFFPKRGDNGEALYLASNRLAQALNRLESNLHSAIIARNSQNYEQMAFFEQENNLLKRESDSLRRALLQLQEQYSKLYEVAAEIHGRLDQSIKKIDQVIDA